MPVHSSLAWQAKHCCSRARGERVAGRLAMRGKARAVTPGNDDGPILIPATPPKVLEGESQHWKSELHFVAIYGHPTQLVDYVKQGSRFGEFPLSGEHIRMVFCRLTPRSRRCIVTGACLGDWTCHPKGEAIWGSNGLTFSVQSTLPSIHPCVVKQ